MIAWLLVLSTLSACQDAKSSPQSSRAAPVQWVLAPYHTLRHQGIEWLFFDLDLTKVEISLVGQRPAEPARLAAIEPLLRKRQRTLVMATNAGIFSPERRPMGLHVQEGEVLSALSLGAGEGNFFLKPNGVFWVDQRGAHVTRAEDYNADGKVQLATQSGPLLLERAQIHPAFSEKSTSLRVRSGVGVDGRGHVIVALSRGRVSFHAMATLFRDVLGCPDALFLDGEISALAAPNLPAPPPVDYGGILVATLRER